MTDHSEGITQAVLDGGASAKLPSLANVPPEVLLDNILPRLASKDLSSLSRVDKNLHVLANDSSVWRTKTATDFSYRASALALASQPGEKRDDGWFRRVYLGLEHPRTYLWGTTANSRLGDVNAHSTRFVRSVESPMDITRLFNAAISRAEPQTTGTSPAPDQDVTAIVDLQAGGWSFAARDSQGGIWVWGTLDGQRLTLAQGEWTDEGCQVDTPTRIPLPVRAEAMALGRRHLVVLDRDNIVWEMRAYGKAYHHKSGQLTAPSQTGAAAPGRAPHIVDVSAGWDLTACLASSGDIHIWFPFSDDYGQATDRQALSGPGNPTGDLGPALHWGSIDGDLVQTADRIPKRADERSSVNEAFEAAAVASYHSDQELEQIVKIACGYGFIIALKRNGEVWALPVQDERIGAWEYMANFSSPTTTHITVQFRNVMVYSTPVDASSSSVLMWPDADVRPGCGQTVEPVKVPFLDNLPVIQVVAGDWHFAALTTRGEMYTWGENNHDQLGLGSAYRQQRHVAEPVRVQFPPDADGKQPFVFAIAAAGFHTGALVLGHKRKEEDKQAEKEAHAPPNTNANQASIPQTMFGSFPFRIGRAGAFGRIGGGGRGSRGGMMGGRGGSST